MTPAELLQNRIDLLNTKVQVNNKTIADLKQGAIDFIKSTMRLETENEQFESEIKQMSVALSDHNNLNAKVLHEYQSETKSQINQALSGEPRCAVNAASDTKLEM